MRRHGRNILCILVIMIAVLSNVSAASITWKWRQNDERVQFYRYQVNGEVSDNWTVVSSDVLSYRLDEAVEDESYTLYLQQSYDGLLWSETTSSTAYVVSKDSTPAVEPVSEEAAATVEEEVIPAVSAVRYVESPLGTISINADESTVVITYPESLASYAALLPAYHAETYPEIMEYVTVTEAENSLVGTYAILIDDQAMLDSYADMLKAELESLIAEYVSVPVVEEEAVVVAEAVEEEPVVVAEGVVALEPVEAVKEESTFKFSLLFKGGVGNRISVTPFKFENGVENMRANAGIAFDFTNVVAIGSHFGFGLRSDISADILVSPKLKGWSNVDKNNFYKAEDTYDYDVSADLKLMANLSGGPVDFYLGGGFGYSLFNQANTPEANETHTLKQIKLFGATYDSAWFASALAGIRFNITDVFSLGTEVSYRFMLPAKTHIASADLVLGFTF